MKTNFLLVLSAMAATVFANPTSDDNLVARKEICRKASSCSAFWSGKCEEYCAPYKFSHMSGDTCDGALKRCCCDA
ncbi:uncharacterized protein KD926_009822 [Aspergillus affinis]|uniref:uncharacterized protein n=1 Tax=Aspergillus affinis TaxID=1070780 RepID=UPI0022FE3EDC|nr:uncharacterized protein KD926_009822 [Aspergillus affinis]KAI9039188.1 hypothetical protein KD926_009822 [Aspergillus affinis]